MPVLAFSDSVVIARSPEEVYDLVSDVTRTGEWSPTCTACWWDEGADGSAGSGFTGRNEVPGRTWETRSTVVTADRGREFAWVVGDGWVSWRYLVEPAPEGSRLTEAWEFLPAGLAMFEQRYGDAAPVQVEDRCAAALRGIPQTLAALRRILDAG